jgi:L-rhamnose mutarotase
MTNEEIWCNNLEKVKEYIYKNKKRPSSESKDTEVRKLGRWTFSQKTNYKNNTFSMNNKEIKEKWEEFCEEYSEYLMTNEEIWYDTLEKVKEYIYKNKKKPSEYSKDTEVRKLCIWILHQKTNYKTNTRSMNNEEIKEKWEEFCDEYSEYLMTNEEKWCDSLEKVKEYIYKNKKRPSSTSKDVEAKSLGTWILHQKTNYKNNKDSMNNEEIKEKWEEFCKEYSDFL